MKRELAGSNPNDRAQAELCLQEVHRLMQQSAENWTAVYEGDDKGTSFVLAVVATAAPAKAETVVADQAPVSEPAPKAVDSIAHD